MDAILGSGSHREKVPPIQPRLNHLARALDRAVRPRLGASLVRRGAGAAVQRVVVPRRCFLGRAGIIASVAHCLSTRVSHV